MIGQNENMKRSTIRFVC